MSSKLETLPLSLSGAYDRADALFLANNRDNQLTVLRGIPNATIPPRYRSDLRQLAERRLVLLQLPLDAFEDIAVEFPARHNARNVGES